MLLANVGINLGRGSDMSEEKIAFNRGAVRQELSEALLALQRSEQKTQSGAYDGDPPLAIAVDFHQVLTHLCLAWHFKEMTHEQIRTLTQEEFDRLANTIPNFGFRLKLMSGIDSEDIARTLNSTRQP
jgi:hypothetical protein